MRSVEAFDKVQIVGAVVANSVTAGTLTADTLVANALAWGGDVVANTLRVDGPAIRLTTGASTGNSGVVFGNAAYAGPLVEARTSAIERYGLSVAPSATRVHAGTATSAGTVNLSFALGEATFVDGLTVVRSGSTANVGVNTTAPKAALQVVGDVLANGNLTVSRSAFVATALGVGTANPLAALHVAGNLRVSANAFVDGQFLSLTTGSTAGNSGVIFGNAAYAGPLVELRAAANERYGLSAVVPVTRVHASTANSSSSVNLSFATGEGTFVDGLTVVRSGSTANVGVNTTTPQAALQVIGNVLVTGTVYASGDVTAFSDSRLKVDLQPIGDAPNRLARLTGYTYARPDLGNSRHAGLLAQELRAVLPEAVVETNGTLAVSHAGVAALLVNAVNDLRERIEALEARLVV